ncbi:hypothetical protein HYH03_008835 [Edaphochlamys debaryana]|uniref:Guanylate cyclase domain-containing protein n=1 Tax=Edaphochlamys debaryana TaxID=47281 RepID=A0A835Y0C5_9CHLO|nr:hypothetical protein HYH03_008835 [Edaphochlamys debaryana]|eukprot:KAG2492922.1 hypothetical protein HYH03_008835 [Edaphochlamys debaryana]
MAALFESVRQSLTNGSVSDALDLIDSLEAEFDASTAECRPAPVQLRVVMYLHPLMPLQLRRTRDWVAYQARWELPPPPPGPSSPPAPTSPPFRPPPSPPPVSLLALAPATPSASASPAPLLAAATTFADPGPDSTGPPGPDGPSGPAGDAPPPSDSDGSDLTQMGLARVGSSAGSNSTTGPGGSKGGDGGGTSKWGPDGFGQLLNVTLGVEARVLVELPPTQFEVNWLSMPPPFDSGFMAQVLPHDYYTDYYYPLYDWSAGNGSVVEEVESRAPNLPTYLEPIGTPPANTWLALLYRRDWMPAAAAALTPPAGPGGSNPAAAPPGASATMGGSWAADVSNGITNGSSQAGASPLAADAPLLPATWEALAAMAAAAEGRDLDGDGTPDHGLCLDVRPGCKAWSVLSAVYVSIAQRYGKQQGAWFDRDSMAPLVGGPAMRAALATWRRLAAVAWTSANGSSPNATDLPGDGSGSGSGSGSDTAAGDAPPDSVFGANFTGYFNDGGDCEPVNLDFADGRCLFTLEWTVGLPFLRADLAPNLAGRLGVALPPGSSRVWVAQGVPVRSPRPPRPPPGPAAPPSPAADLARAAAQAEEDGAGPLVECSADPGLCPYAATAPGGSLVNVAPFTSVARSDVWSSDYPPPTLRGREALGALMQMWLRTPDRYEALLGASLGANASAVDWGALGYDPRDGPSLAAGLAAGERHPNAAADIMTVHSAGYRMALDAAAARALVNASSPGATATDANSSSGSGTAGGSDADAAVAARLAADFTFVFDAIPFPKTIRAMYWKNLGYKGPPADSTTPSPSPEAAAAAAGGGGGGSSRSAVLTVAVAVPIGALVLLLVGCALLMYRYYNHLGLLTGRVRPPRHGPDVTLVSTDIQNSTLLWETLPAEDMSVVLSQHHAVMRSELDAHGGYEAATEGDAFLLAFHTASAALSFCVNVQLRLLEVNWPAALLATPDGAEVWVAPSPQVSDALRILSSYRSSRRNLPSLPSLAFRSSVSQTLAGFGWGALLGNAAANIVGGGGGGGGLAAGSSRKAIAHQTSSAFIGSDPSGEPAAAGPIAEGVAAWRQALASGGSGARSWRSVFVQTAAAAAAALGETASGGRRTASSRINSSRVGSALAGRGTGTGAGAGTQTGTGTGMGTGSGSERPSGTGYEPMPPGMMAHSPLPHLPDLMRASAAGISGSRSRSGAASPVPRFLATHHPDLAHTYQHQIQIQIQHSPRQQGSPRGKQHVPFFQPKPAQPRGQREGGSEGEQELEPGREERGILRGDLEAGSLLPTRDHSFLPPHLRLPPEDEAAARAAAEVVITRAAAAGVGSTAQHGSIGSVPRRQPPGPVCEARLDDGNGNNGSNGNGTNGNGGGEANTGPTTADSSTPHWRAPESESSDSVPDGPDGESSDKVQPLLSSRFSGALGPPAAASAGLSFALSPNPSPRSDRRSLRALGPGPPSGAYAAPAYAEGFTHAPAFAGANRGSGSGEAVPSSPPRLEQRARATASPGALTHPGELTSSGSAPVGASLAAAAAAQEGRVGSLCTTPRRRLAPGLRLDLPDGGGLTAAALTAAATSAAAAARQGLLNRFPSSRSAPPPEDRSMGSGSAPGGGGGGSTGDGGADGGPPDADAEVEEAEACGGDVYDVYEQPPSTAALRLARVLYALEASNSLRRATAATTGVSDFAFGGGGGGGGHGLGPLDEALLASVGLGRRHSADGSASMAGAKGTPFSNPAFVKASLGGLLGPGTGRMPTVVSGRNTSSDGGGVTEGASVGMSLAPSTSGRRRRQSADGYLDRPSSPTAVSSQRPSNALPDGSGGRWGLGSGEIGSLGTVGSGRPMGLSMDGTGGDSGGGGSSGCALEETLNCLLAAASMGRIAANSLLSALKQLWNIAAAPDQADGAGLYPVGLNPPVPGSLGDPGGVLRPVLALRGLRVRMGVHSGLNAAEVVETRRGQCEYRGGAMARVKAVGDLAAGGVIVLTESTHAAYRLDRRRLSQLQLLHLGEPRHVLLPEPSGRPGGLGVGALASVASMAMGGGPLQGVGGGGGGGGGGGQHLASGSAHPLLSTKQMNPSRRYLQATGATSTRSARSNTSTARDPELYLLLDARLLPRHGVVGPFRTAAMLDPRSTFLAPLGSITAAFVLVSGVKALRAWNGPLLGESLALLHRYLTASAAEAGGYVVAAAEGLAVVVFACPAAAVAWAVVTQERVLQLPWAAALLDHDFGEEVRRDGRVVLRGLRLKMGLETGVATARLVPRMGRLDYTGRTLNRASRIATKAGQGGVFVSAALWLKAQAAADSQAQAAAAMSGSRGGSRVGSRAVSRAGTLARVGSTAIRTAAAAAAVMGVTSVTAGGGMPGPAPPLLSRAASLAYATGLAAPVASRASSYLPGVTAPFGLGVSRIGSSIYRGPAAPGNESPRSLAAAASGTAAAAAAAAGAAAGGGGGSAMSPGLNRYSPTGASANASSRHMPLLAPPPTPGMLFRELVGTSQGMIPLKGVKELVELIQVERCRLPLALNELEALLSKASKLSA